MAFHPLLTATFRDWNQRSLRWVLLRLPLDPIAPNGDVDILVHPADVQDLSDSLARHGFSPLPRLGYGPDRFYLAYHEASDRWLWLHVTSAIAFGPLQLYRTDTALSCLERRRRQGTLSLLDPEDAFWLLLLHCLLDKGGIEVRHRACLRELATRVSDDGPLASLIAALAPPDCTPDTIVEWARCGRWERIGTLAPVLEDAFRRSASVTRRALLARRVGRLLTRCLNVSQPLLWRRYICRRRLRASSSPHSPGAP